MITSYEITLKHTHLEWCSYRYTNSRGVVYGEGYIPIPANVAYSNNISIKMELTGKMFLEKIFFIAVRQTAYIKELFEHKEIKIILDM